MAANTCLDCGHGWHGPAECLQCEDAAQVGCLAPCASVPCSHEPDARGVKCAHCGIKAEMVPPDELAGALYAAIVARELAEAGQLGMFGDA